MHGFLNSKKCNRTLHLFAKTYAHIHIHMNAYLFDESMAKCGTTKSYDMDISLKEREKKRRLNMKILLSKYEKHSKMVQNIKETVLASI